ncbi:MAG: bifunctional diaminohydroxyphosphoribosylaminopyrimidine deaminase/5-amino-6-(5-phosphoribosylamino)uracil reductase RibD, partial [Acidipila sp.]|nr:bifunctional diaminohydroxyphosphoribosylaminopyrimidine deaminase/5-amino-6-(5-phosphoribosylamino)uracil reductase RibD [Acidipila sp.]
RALDLARQGEAFAHPNPRVGAVLVKNGRVLGEGFHNYTDSRHAEVIAIEKAIKKHPRRSSSSGAAAASLRGASLYVNLEPCCHTGRTAPCTDAVIAAGIRKVFVAMRDPDPRVSGRGIARLRRAGIVVEVGLLEPEARRLNEGFARWIRTRRPLVTLKLGMTLDGRVASPKKSERWITSPQSREAVQQMRHAADAVVTGIGTVLKDDPFLTDRTGLKRRRPLVRVVLDSRLRLPLKSNLVRSAQGDVLVFTRQPEDSRKALALEDAGVEVMTLPGRGKRLPLKEVFAELGELSLLGVMLEAGPTLVDAALHAGVVDKLMLFIAPKFLGGRALALLPDGFRSLAGAPQLRDIRLHRFGPDFAIEGYFRPV